MDEELDQMMADALSEIEEIDNDTDTDEGQQEESTDIDNDEREDGDNQQDDTQDEDVDDQESDDIDEEKEDNQDDQAEDNEEIDEDNQEKQVVEFEPIEVFVNGQSISINDKEELMAFVKRGASSMGTQPRRKSQNDQIIEQGKLSNDDLTLLIDAKNGNKAAIAKLAKDSGVDLYDIEDEVSYQPEFNPHFMSEADEVAEEMLQDQSFVDTFQQVIKSVPPEFTAKISSDADALRNFGEHIRSGLAQKIIPEAIKQQMLHGGDFMQYYSKIGKKMYNEAEKPSKESKTKRVMNPRADKLRKRASNKKGSNKSGKVANGDDIWNLSDKDFAEKYGM